MLKTTPEMLEDLCRKQFAFGDLSVADAALVFHDARLAHRLVERLTKLCDESGESVGVEDVRRIINGEQ